MPEQYRINEKVRMTVEGVVTHPFEGNHLHPAELTITLETTAGLYDVTVPLDAAKVERLAPTVLPREIWGDRDGDVWWSVCVLGFDTPRTMMLPGELHDLRAVGDSMLSPEDVDGKYGPITRVYPPAPAPGITRVYPPAPAPGTTGGQAEETSPEQPDEPRLMLDDVWEDRVGDIWRVVADATAVGGLGLTLVRNGALITWTDVVSSSGPLVLLERAGCRRTTATPTAGQAEQPAAPRVTLSDRWKDGDGEIWWGATDAFGEPGLTLGDCLCTWGEVDGAYGPLTLIERAGYRPTGGTVTAGQLRRGTVVSCEEWEDAPVTITGWRVIADDVCRLEFEYRPLGGDRTTVVPTHPDMQVTVWEPARNEGAR